MLVAEHGHRIQFVCIAIFLGLILSACEREKGKIPVPVQNSIISTGTTTTEDSSLKNFKTELDRPISRDVLGVLEIPSIYPVDGVFKDKPRAVEIRSAPDKDSKIIMLIQSPSDLISTSTGYEWKQALVYGQTQGWYLVHSRKGRGWIQESKELRFTSIPSLLRSSKLGLDRWDEKLYSQSVYSSQIINLPFLVKPTSSIELTCVCNDYTYSDGSLWLKVKINAANPCENTPIFPTDIEGWVPAYDSNGFLVLRWWSSC